jgi:hypothetical protein
MKDPIKQARGRASTPIKVENAAGWAPDQHAPQSPDDRPAPGGSGDVAKGWLRGFGGGEAMPGFDKSGPSGSRDSNKRK